MTLSWRAPARHRYCVVVDGVAIASAQTLDGALAYWHWAISPAAIAALCVAEMPIQVFETREVVRA